MVSATLLDLWECGRSNSGYRVWLHKMQQIRMLDLGRVWIRVAVGENLALWG